MTTQEYVKKEAEAKCNNWLGIGAYEDGLSAGIELAKEVLIKFAGCSEYRATELIEIHITERNGK